MTTTKTTTELAHDAGVAFAQTRIARGFLTAADRKSAESASTQFGADAQWFLDGYECEVDRRTRTTREAVTLPPPSPGPWKVAKGHQIKDANGQIIGHAQAPDLNDDDAITVANATVMAAAHEMLAALLAAKNAISNNIAHRGGHTHPGESQAFKQIRDAIAKAKGAQS